jgi:2-keto-3-deoxy-L-rhamnonate aldolase RhmA
MRISGSAEITGYDMTPAPARAEAIIANARFTFPELKNHFDISKSKVWAGLRPVSPSGTPIVGETRIRGVWINAGHGHLGWTLSCGSGRLIADLMDGRDPGVPVPPPQGVVVARAQLEIDLSQRLPAQPLLSAIRSERIGDAIDQDVALQKSVRCPELCGEPASAHRLRPGSIHSTALRAMGGISSLETSMTADHLKNFAGNKSLKLGHFIVEFATPGIGHILKSAGCDFVLFDLEHSGFHFETVKSAIRYFEAADLPVIIRAPSKEYHHIARAMDMGAEGLMLPMVGSAPEARNILNSMKYAPDGGRGVALQVSHDRYRPGAITDKFAAANRRSTLFCQIETAEGVKNADAIAALPGVDCLWVGHFDLSVSLGVPGQFDSKKFTDAIKRVVAAAAKHGKSLGRLCRAWRRDSSSTARVSISSAIRAMSGCCKTRWRKRSASSARAARRRGQGGSDGRAGAGIGTLYRHFPTRGHLVELVDPREVAPNLPMGDCQMMKSWLLRKPTLFSQRDRWPYELTAM